MDEALNKYIDEAVKKTPNGLGAKGFYHTLTIHLLESLPSKEFYAILNAELSKVNNL
jgi:hypothetical protein